MSMHQEVACRYPTGHLQATRAARHHDHGRRRVRLWLSTASRRRGRRLWATRGLLGWVVVAGAAHPVWTAGHLWGGCPARPQWARRAIGRGRGPDHSVGAQSVAPRLWTAPLSKDGLGRHRPRAGAGRFAAVAKTVCVRPVEGRAHTGGLG